MATLQSFDSEIEKTRKIVSERHHDEAVPIVVELPDHNRRLCRGQLSFTDPSRKGCPGLRLGEDGRHDHGCLIDESSDGIGIRLVQVQLHEAAGV